LFTKTEDQFVTLNAVTLSSVEGGYKMCTWHKLSGSSVTPRNVPYGGTSDCLTLHVSWCLSACPLETAHAIQVTPESFGTSIFSLLCYLKRKTEVSATDSRKCKFSLDYWMFQNDLVLLVYKIIETMDSHSFYLKVSQGDYQRSNYYRTFRNNLYMALEINLRKFCFFYVYVLLRCLLQPNQPTNSMEQSPSCKPNCSSTNQDIPAFIEP
jgi:hypothetical protein